MTKTRSLLVPAVLALALIAIGCGDSTEPSVADRYADKAEQELKDRKPVATPKPVAAEKVTPPAAEADLETAPKIAKPTGAAPKELVVQDLIVGDGQAVKAGDQITVEYVGIVFKSGKQFETTWGKDGEPAQFTLTEGSIIDGWYRGLIGMKVGGRRKLIIPSELAYGTTGSPPDIAPGDSLVFDIDLKKIG